MKRPFENLVAILALVTAFEVVAQGIDQGFAKYQSGDFSGALSDLVPLAERGDATAQALVGMMFGNGQGVEPDSDVAATWMRLAAEQEHVQAQVILARMYTQGVGVTADLGEAANWYRRAADQGDAEAQFQLGVMYETGVSVVTDNVEAAGWYRRSAEQGHNSAQFNLGVMYYNGDGLDQDNVLAHVWTTIAAANGHVNAATARDAIGELLTSTDIYESREIALNCIEVNYQGCRR